SVSRAKPEGNEDVDDAPAASRHGVLSDHFAEIKLGAALTATLITSTAFRMLAGRSAPTLPMKRIRHAPPGSSNNILPQHRVDAEGGSISGISNPKLHALAHP